MTGGRRFILGGSMALFALLVGLCVAEGLCRLWFKPYTHAVYDVDPKKRIAFLPGSRAAYRTREFDVLFQINSHGRRDIEWTPGVVRDPQSILFIGDSSVLGYGVDDARSLPTLLEYSFRKQGSQREVFNFGMAGAIGIPEYRALLEEAFRLGIEARIVLVGLCVVGDFGSASAAEPPPAPSGLNLRRSAALARLVRDAIYGSPRLAGVALTVRRRLGRETFHSPLATLFLRDRPEAQTEHFQRILEGLLEIQRICRRHERSLHVVLFPSGIQVENPEAFNPAIFDLDQPDRQIRDFCARHAIACLDLLPRLRVAYRENRTPLYFPIDRHMNPGGNAAAAKAIFEWLNLPG